MRSAEISTRVLTILFVCTLSAYPLAAISQNQTAADPASLTLDEKEEFLKNGSIMNEKFVAVGVTHSMRITLEYKGMTHDAHVQTIDENMPSVQAGRSQAAQSHDYYGFNIAVMNWTSFWD